MERLQGQLGPASGPPVPLDGGITNRNYRVRFGAARLRGAAAWQGHGAARDQPEAERIANAAAARFGIAPEVAAADERAWSPVRRLRADRRGRLRGAPEPVARALRAFHDSGTQLPVRFWVPELLDDYAAIVAERGGALPESYGAPRGARRRIAAALPLNEPVPCHDDLLPANLLSVEVPGERDAGRLGIRRHGSPLFDLGNLAVNNEFDEPAEERLLAAYFGEPPSPAQRAAL